VLTFMVKDPTPEEKKKRSRWHCHLPLPMPCEKLDWETHFAPMERTIGNVIATVRWDNHRLKTYAYFDTEEHARDFMQKYIIPLSTLPPVLGNDKQAVRVSKSGSPKRQPRNRVIHCIQAVWVSIDPATGEQNKIYCLTPST
jgi:hypothetical protein